MSTEVKQASKAKATKAVLRKATFTVEVSKQGVKVFRPVNKRAHKWAKKMGKRTKCTLEDIKAIKATKRVKVYAYGEGGKPVFVR